MRTCVVLRGLLILVALLFAAPGWADTTPVTTGPFASEKVKRRIATTSAVVKSSVPFVLRGVNSPPGEQGTTKTTGSTDRARPRPPRKAGRPGGR